MKRLYLSGARKREIAEEKKRKDAVLLSKIPKLSDMFQNENMPAGSAGDASDEPMININEVETLESASNMESIAGPSSFSADAIVANDNNQADEQLIDESATTSGIGNEFNTSSSEHSVNDRQTNEQAVEAEKLYSCDAALWDMTHGLEDLRFYWTKHGNAIECFSTHINTHKHNLSCLFLVQGHKNVKISMQISNRHQINLISHSIIWIVDWLMAK